jgi:transcription elongation GreA/GreB family factor
MAKTYKVASPEGAARYGAEEGEQVELDLPDEEETAVVAAGWLEPVTSKSGKKGE